MFREGGRWGAQGREKVSSHLEKGFPPKVVWGLREAASFAGRGKKMEKKEKQYS